MTRARISPRDSRRVTFRVTSRWQKPQMGASGRQPRKRIRRRETAGSESLERKRPVLLGFLKRVWRLPMPQPALVLCRRFMSHGAAARHGCVPPLRTSSPARQNSLSSVLRAARRSASLRSAFRLSRELAQKPGLREFPIPHDGLSRDLQYRACLLDR